MPLSKKIKEIVSEITGDKYILKLTGRDLTKKSKAPVNRAYIFHYPNPVTKKSLPYFMEFPVVVIIARYGNRILGVNLQHLTWTYSIRLANYIARKIKNKKRSLKYGDIKDAIKSVKVPQSMLYFALRMYRVDRISGNVYAIEMVDYAKAVKDVPRISRKKQLSAAIKYNMARYYDYIRKQKEDKKARKK